MMRSILASLLVLTASPALAQSPDQQPPPTPPAPEPPQPPQPPQPPAPPEPPQPAQPAHDNWGVPPAHEEPPPLAPVAAPPADKPPAHAKWDATFYGFVEADTILDSTQGLSDLVGSSAIQRPGSYVGDHGQMMMGARNSRFGVKLAAPDYNGIKASGMLEMDFLGNQPGSVFTSYGTATGGATGSTALISEQQFWQNPTMRFRHANVKLETKVVDILIGQYWQLFGWQSTFHPSSVEIQGLPGQVYSRSPQIRVSKKIKSGDVAVEVAIAASRPPQRASATPDGQAGIKVSYDGVKALHTAGATGTATDGLSIGVSAVGRRFAVANYATTESYQVTKDGYGLSIDALIPIVPAHKDRHDNATTLTASYTTGAGIADLYQSLSGGVSNPALPNPTMANPAPAWVPNVDPGLVMWFPDAAAAGGFSLHAVQWSTAMVGLQYYLPVKNYTWLAVNYSNTQSDNAKYFGGLSAAGAKKVWNSENFYDVSLLSDVTPAVRLGLEGALYDMTYVDNTEGKDYRLQFSAFYLF